MNIFVPSRVSSSVFLLCYFLFFFFLIFVSLYRYISTSSSTSTRYWQFSTGWTRFAGKHFKCGFDAGQKLTNIAAFYPSLGVRGYRKKAKKFLNNRTNCIKNFITHSLTNRTALWAVNLRTHVANAHVHTFTSAHTRPHTPPHARW